MILDARADIPAAAAEADVCVVGGGPAGISLALTLAGRGKRVLLLESGGREPDEATQDLYGGEADVGDVQRSVHLAGPSSHWAGLDDYLRHTRLRYLGGTSNHWGGYCRRLDPIDFAARDWIPGSGWPLAHAELAEAYAAAEELCEVVPFSAATGLATAPLAEGRAAIEDPATAADFTLTRYHFSQPTRFGTRYAAELEQTPGITALLHANLVGLRWNDSGTRVVAADAATLTGRRLSVRARAFVLACGGVENARLLLLLREAQAPGDESRFGPVGRFFADHPHIMVGSAGLWTRRGCIRRVGPISIGRANGLKRHLLWTYAPSEAFQRRHRTLNCSFDFIATEIEREEAETTLLTAADALDGRRFPPPPGDRPGGKPRVTQAHVLMRAETAPDEGSRVRLDPAARDALGLPRARLTWRPAADLPAHTATTAAAFARFLAARGLGRMRLAPELSAGGLPQVGHGSHHIGTTRMSATPGSGVVDPQCKVHGVDNLYVAGSSVFPTTGFSNPTLTLVALAVRLGRHLGART